MAGSANDLLRSRNAEKLQPGTKNRHRTQPWTNRVHNLVGERGHAKSLICHTEWSDQRQENDVIELIRAPFHVIGRMSAFRSTRSFSCLSNFIHPDNTHIWDTFTACVSRPIVRNRSGRHTHYTTLSDSSFAHHSRCFRLPLAHKRRKECNESAHDRVLFFWDKKGLQEVGKESSVPRARRRSHTNASQ